MPQPILAARDSATTDSMLLAALEAARLASYEALEDGKPYEDCVNAAVSALQALASHATERDRGHSCDC